MIEKLSNVKPKVLTSEDWRSHAAKIDKMQGYMTHYGGHRSYSKVRSASSSSIFRFTQSRSQIRNNGTANAFATAADETTLEDTPLVEPLTALEAQALAGKQSRHRQLFKTQSPPNVFSSTGLPRAPPRNVLMQSDIIPPELSTIQPGSLGIDEAQQQQQFDSALLSTPLTVDLSMRPQTASNLRTQARI